MQKLKHILIGLTLFLFSNTVHADEMEKLNSGIGILSDKIVKQMQSHKVKLIAMGDFDNSNGKTQFERNIEIGLVNNIVTQNLSDISVIERKNLSEVLKEQKLGNSGLLAKKTRAKLGAILGVEAIVTAETTVLKRKVTVNVRMYSINTGRILAAPSYTFLRSETIDELLDQPAEESRSYGGEASRRTSQKSTRKPYKQEESTCFSNKYIQGCSKISRSKDKKRVTITTTLINHSDIDLYLGQLTHNNPISCELMAQGTAYNARTTKGLTTVRRRFVDKNKIDIDNLTVMNSKSKLSVTYGFQSREEIAGDNFDFSSDAVMYYSDGEGKDIKKQKFTISGTSLYIPSERITKKR